MIGAQQPGSSAHLLITEYYQDASVDHTITGTVSFSGLHKKNTIRLDRRQVESAPYKILWRHGQAETAAAHNSYRGQSSGHREVVAGRLKTRRLRAERVREVTNDLHPLARENNSPLLLLARGAATLPVANRLHARYC